MPSTSDAPFERRLISEIALIDQKISDLEAEKAALMRQLLKARENRPELRDVNRRNSAQRVIVEGAILDLLVQRGDSVSNRVILDHIRMTKLHDLNENTLRTYLHRMKERGLVVSPARGKWKVLKE